MFQVNFNYCKAAQELLRNIVKEYRTDLAILREHYRTSDEPQWTACACEKTTVTRRKSLLNVRLMKYIPIIIIFLLIW